MYLFYIDESGTPGRAPSLPSGIKDVFALVAVGMLDRQWRGFNYTMRQFKRKLYEQDAQKPADTLEIKDYEVKSHWLRLPKKRSDSSFLGPLSTESLENLTAAYFGELPNRKITLLGVVMDKTASQYDHRQTRREAMELLYEQIEAWMWGHSRHKAIVIVDDCDTRTNYQIAARHADMLRTQTRTGIQFRNIVETPLFTRSELSEGIQLADLCAYSTYRAFAHDDIEYHYFQKILPYFHRFKGAENTKDIESIIRILPDDKRFPSLLPRKGQFAPPFSHRRKTPSHLL